MLDLRKSGPLWADPISPDLEHAYARVLNADAGLAERCAAALGGAEEGRMSRLLDDLTRFALAGDWPQFPLVVIDEVHGLKNPWVQARQNFEAFAAGRVCRLLGLSATPFQLRHEELLERCWHCGVCSPCRRIAAWCSIRQSPPSKRA